MWLCFLDSNVLHSDLIRLLLQVLAYLAAPIAALVLPSVVCGIIYLVRSAASTLHIGGCIDVKLKTYLIYTRTTFILLVFLMYNKVRSNAQCVQHIAITRCFLCLSFTFTIAGVK